MEHATSRLPSAVSWAQAEAVIADRGPRLLGRRRDPSIPVWTGLRREVGGDADGLRLQGRPEAGR